MRESLSLSSQFSLVAALLLVPLLTVAVLFYTYRVSYTEIRTEFPISHGLAVGAEVNMSGVPIGHVSSVGLSPGGRVAVSIRIHRKALKIIPVDSSVVLCRSLVGRTVYIEPGSQSDKIGRDGQLIGSVRDSRVTSPIPDLGRWLKAL
jgi:ABC-type transporter Mla subunit MlaD